MGIINVVITENVYANFISTDWTEGKVSLVGKVTFNYEKSSISSLKNLENTLNRSGVKIYLDYVSRLQDLIVDDWLTWY